MARKKSASNAVVRPNLGLHLDRPSISLEPGMLKDGLNFRIKNGRLSNLNLGWTRFDDFTLNGPVMLIKSFRLGSVDILVFATDKDLYRYDAASNNVVFISPIYATGTAAASGTAVTGTGTTWTTNAKAGDEISFGANDETDPAATWYEIESVNADDSITLTSSAGTVADGAYTIRKTFTGDYGDFWDADVFVDADDGAGGVETQLWLTNGIDAPVRWNGTDAQVELMTALNFTCKQLHVYSNMMIFGNITQSGTNKVTDVINSDVGAPDDVSSGLSEQFKVHDDPDGINRLQKLGDVLAIYSKNHITIAQFVGGDVVFVFRTISNTVGPIAGRAMADFGDYHQFISNDGMYRFNGAALESINDHVWREILRQQDPVRSYQAFSFFDDQNAELLWVMPLISDTGSGTETSPPAKAFVEHYMEDVQNIHGPTQHVHTAYSARSFIFTAIGYYSRQAGLTWDQISDQWQELNFRWDDQFFSVSFPLILVGTADGKIYNLNAAQSLDGAALNSYVTFGRQALIDGRLRGLLTRIIPFVRPFDNDIDITVKMYDHASATTAASTTTIAYDQNLTESDYFVTPYRRGRFMELTFGTNGVSLPWELEGYDLELRPGGKR